MDFVLQTKHLCRCFGAKEAVQDLSIQVPSGSIFAYLGPNGAGKSTTIKLLMNILTANSGEALVLGVDSRRLSPAEFQQIGYVAEDQRAPGWLTVEGFLNYVKPMYPAWDGQFCLKLLKQFDLPLDRKLKHLSRGMRMKAVLLSSLAYRPRLLVLDEPFTGLDPLVRDEFIRGILELTEQEQWTVFISSHDIDEVERLADWVGIINEGRLCENEAVEALQARFRRIQIAAQDEGALPPGLPAAWLLPEKQGHAAQFVDSRYDETATAEKIRSAFPSCGSINTNPMSLREIFLTLAKTYRFAEGKR